MRETSEAGMMSGCRCSFDDDLFVPKADLFVHERNFFFVSRFMALTTLEQSTSTRGKTTAPVGHGCGAANASNKLWPRCRLVDGVDCQHDVPRNFCE